MSNLVLLGLTIFFPIWGNFLQVKGMDDNPPLY